MGGRSLKFDPEFSGEYAEPDLLTRHRTGLILVGELTRSEWDNAGATERVVEIWNRENPGSGRGLETVEEKNRLGRRREAVAPVDRTVMIDRAIEAAIFTGEPSMGKRDEGFGSEL